MRGKGQGRATAEYGILSRATHTRSPREAARDKQSGRRLGGAFVELARRPELHVSVSYTTRARRATEEPGKDYCFVSLEEFRELIARDALLEHARVFDNCYGTARAPLEEQLARGHHVILEIDWQGAQQVRRKLPGCCSLPPSKAALERRLRRRATDTEEAIARRLMDAVGDMSHSHEFDYVLVNDSFDHAVDDLVRIIDGNGADLAATRPSLQPLLAELTGHP